MQARLILAYFQHKEDLEEKYRRFASLVTLGGPRNTPGAVSHPSPQRNKLPPFNLFSISYPSMIIKMNVDMVTKNLPYNSYFSLSFLYLLTTPMVSIVAVGQTYSMEVASQPLFLNWLSFLIFSLLSQVLKLCYQRYDSACVAGTGGPRGSR